MPTTNPYGLGANRQRYDPRDLKLSLAPGDHPTRVDLSTSPSMPPVWNQQSLGSCTAFATGAARWFAYRKAGYHNVFTPSALYQYWNSRQLEGTTGSDNGASIRDAIKASVTHGWCADHWWPYSDANPGPFTQQPPAATYTNAERHLTTVYRAVSLDTASITTCLASGWPIVVGIVVHESFFNAPNGDVPMPTASDPVAGGHAVLLIGYDDKTQRVRFRNSWSASWGTGGNGSLPYAYLTDPSLAFDAWVVSGQH